MGGIEMYIITERNTTGPPSAAPGESSVTYDDRH